MSKPKKQNKEGKREWARKNQAAKRERNECCRCHSPALNGKRSCQVHLDMQNKRYVKYKERGVCACCKSVPTNGETVYCEQCAHNTTARNNGYKLTLPDRQAMLARQNGACAICQTVCKLHVDHDHQTGKIRGMLCHKCNKAVGGFNDSPEILRNALDYLSPPEENRSARSR